MTTDVQKVTAAHLKRNAYLYIRQSTPRQVLENVESTKRQYALQQRAIALGWPAERIVVIDSDLGRSGASVVDREGFQKLVAEVGVGHAGLVIGLELSVIRLPARSVWSGQKDHRSCRPASRRLCRDLLRLSEASPRLRSSARAEL
jgi:hypothetical protein